MMCDKQEIYGDSSIIDSSILDIDSEQAGDERRNEWDEFGGDGSILSGFINLANTLFGSGLLTLPFAFANCGIILGITFCSSAAFATGFGLFLLVLCAHKLKGPASFNAVAKAAMPNFSYSMDVMVILQCFGVGAVYLIIIGQVMTSVVVSINPNISSSHVLLEPKLWTSIFMALVIIPISFFRKFTALNFISYIAVLAVMYLVMLIILFFAIPSMGACDGIDNCVGDIELITNSGSILKVLSMFIYSYGCAQNIFPIYNENKSKRGKRVRMMKRVIVSTMCFVCVLYIIVGLLGYLTYGSNVKDNILENFPSGKIYVTVGRIAIVILVIFSYPLQVFPARVSMIKIIVGLHKLYLNRQNRQKRQAPPLPELNTSLCATNKKELAKNFNNKNNELQVPEKLEVTCSDLEKSAIISRTTITTTKTTLPIAQLEEESISSNPALGENLLLHIIVTISFLALTFLISMLVSDLGIVFAIIGATAASSISFIYPGIFYCSMYYNEKYDSKTNMALYFGAIMLSFTGVAVGILSLTFLFM